MIVVLNFVVFADGFLLFFVGVVKTRHQNPIRGVLQHTTKKLKTMPPEKKQRKITTTTKGRAVYSIVITSNYRSKAELDT